jgi:sulfatase maturation enzyme AslB (radical SAM superfamily)
VKPIGTALGSVRSIEAVLTTACNLSCSYCYQDRHDGRAMEWPVLGAVLDLLLGSDHPRPKLTLHGGEPLLARETMRRAADFLDEQQDGKGRVELFTSTNGTLLDRDAIDFLADNDVDPQISCDGVAAAQEARAPGTFGTVDRALRDLRERRPGFLRDNCCVSITLGSHSIPHLAESFDYFLEKGVGEIAVSPLVTHDPGWRPDSITVLADQVLAILARSLEWHRSTGEVPFSPFRIEPETDPGQQRPPGAMCRVACTDRLAVDVDGSVYGCVMIAESYQRRPGVRLGRGLEAMRLGDLRAPSLDRRLEGYPEAVRAVGIFDRKEEKYSTYGRCRDCRFVEVCSVCPVSILHIPGNTDPHRVPDLPCAVNLVLLTCLEGFLGATRAGQRSAGIEEAEDHADA